MTDAITATDGSEAASAEAEALFGEFLGEEGKAETPETPETPENEQETKEETPEPETKESEELKEEEKKEKSNPMKAVRQQANNWKKKAQELEAKIKEMDVDDPEAYIKAVAQKEIAGVKLSEAEAEAQRLLYEQYPNAAEFKDQINQAKESLPDASYEFIYRSVNPADFVDPAIQAQRDAGKTWIGGISPASIKEATPQELASEAEKELQAMWY